MTNESVFYICILILIVLFGGEPDLVTAFINYLGKSSCS